MNACREGRRERSLRGNIDSHRGGAGDLSDDGYRAVGLGCEEDSAVYAVVVERLKEGDRVFRHSAGEYDVQGGAE